MKEDAALNQSLSPSHNTFSFDDQFERTINFARRNLQDHSSGRLTYAPISTPTNYIPFPSKYQA